MRSLKECYEIVKKHHMYWTGDPDDPRFMCIAAQKAHKKGKLTLEESIRTSEDAMSLVMTHSLDSTTLKGALGCAYGKDFAHTAVKDYWDKYIDNMENQDG